MTSLTPDRVLATFHRRRDGRDFEIRVALARLPNGDPILNLRRWILADSGEWLPTKEGVAFKPAELRDLEAAIRAARDVLNGKDPAASPRTEARGECPL